LAIAALAILAPVSAPAQTQTAPATGAISAKDSVALREQARVALTTRDLATAQRLVDRARPIVTHSERTAWWLIEAELENARKHYAKSALAAMQIVILHPKSSEVGAALYWSALSYESLGRPAKAVELYEESIASKKTPKSLRDAASARVSALNKKSP